jgi:integral membrane protein
MNLNSIYSLRLLGNVEGISYLLLLGIAMPMKYFFGFPMAVKIVGMAHGVLFIGYCLLLALQMRANKWNLLFGIYLFVATLIPFGTFVTDQKLAKISAD